MLYVGQKVICVYGVTDQEKQEIHSHTHWFNTYVVEGEVYTVRELFEDYITVVEIVNPLLPYLEGVLECRFKINRFRPLEEWQKADEMVNELMEQTQLQEI